MPLSLPIYRRKHIPNCTLVRRLHCYNHINMCAENRNIRSMNFDKIVMALAVGAEKK